MKTVKEVSRITGVSVRTLHHYDAIGLLKPTAVTKAGYRLYDDAALKRMQSILFFRELQFPLKDIKRILDAPDFDPMTALSQQVHLLEMQREHLEQLISHAREIQRTGVFSMDFSKFDTSEIEKYAVEAKQKWGKTQAWQEFEAKNLPPRQAQENVDGLMDIFARFGAIRDTSPASRETQALVAELQGFITNHYYTCTKEILQSLGQMYIAGDSMTENIDAAGGAGTAQFAHAAIEEFCK